MTSQEFAAKIRAKYPTGIASDGRAYSAISDDELTQKIVEKYPVYSSQIDKGGLVKQTISNVQKLGTGIKEAVVKGGERLREAATTEEIPSGLEGLGSRVLQGAGAGARAIADVGFEGLKAVARQISAVTPDFIEDPIKKKVANAAKTILGTPVNKYALEQISKGFEVWQEFKQDNPKVAKDTEAYLELLSLIPLGRGAKIAKEGAEEGASLIAKEGGEFLGKKAAQIEKGLAKQQVEETVDVVKKGVLTDEARQAALQEGRVIQKRGKTTYLPTDNDLAIAEATQGIVSPTKNAAQNVASLNDEIARVGKENLDLAKNNPAIFNDKTVRAKLTANKEEYKPLFTSEINAEKTYQATIDKFMEILAKEGNTSEGILLARQKFDNYIERTFGEKYLGGPVRNARQAAIKDVRQGANNFLAENLPEGNPLKANLQRQTNMYRAIDNIAEKASPALKEGEKSLLKRAVSALDKVVRESPLGALLVAAGIPTASFLGILTSPATLSVLALGGTYKIGKKLVTSKFFRENLAKALRAGGKVLDGEEKRLIQGVIDQIP